MRLVDYQFVSSLKFHFSRTVNTLNVYDWYEYWICLGPLQIRLAGKPWYNTLFRSPEYISGIKEILLEDLRSMKHG